MKSSRLGQNSQKTFTLIGLFLLYSSSLHGEIVDQLTAYWSFNNTLEDSAGNFSGSANTTDNDLSFFPAPPSSGTAITWQSSVGLFSGGNNEDFVDTTGNLVLAFSGTTNATGSTTVNGVPFQQVTVDDLNSGEVSGVDGVEVTSTFSSGQDTTTAFQSGGFNNPNVTNLLEGGIFDGGSLTFNGLTPGTEYLVQVFLNDARNTADRSSLWVTGFSDGVNNGLEEGDPVAATASLNNRNPNTLQGETSGDSIIGTFIASSSGTLTFDVVGSRDGFVDSFDLGRAQINALQLRLIDANPETPPVETGFGDGLFGGGGYISDGSGHAQTADNADIDENNEMISISAWMRIENFDTDFQTVISKGEGSNYRIARWQETNTVGYAGGTGDIFDTSINLNDGNWHHVAATSGPNGTRLYIDGILTSSSNNTVNLANSNNPLFIGNNPDENDREWNGEIDDVALWHRVLSAEEVTAIHTNGSSGISLEQMIAEEDPPPPVTPGNAFAEMLTAYWPFDGTTEDLAGSFPDTANTIDDDLNFQGNGSGFGSGLFGSGSYSGNGNGHAQVADSADVDEGNNTISISAWILIENFDTSFQTILSKGENTNYRIARRQQTNTVGFAGGTSGDIFDTSVNINDDEWHHVAATAGPSGRRLYIDGVLTSSSNDSINLANSNNPLFIGNNPDADNRQWNGEIDDVALWHRELNAAEVAQIHEAGINNQSLASLMAPAADADADNDGLPDIWEFAFGLNFNPVTGALGDNGASGDPDGDLLSNLDEFTNGTSPIVADTDGDGVSDSSEVNAHGSDPTVADTDGDGSPDGEEVFFGTNPNDDQEFPATSQTLSGIETVGSVGPYLDGVLPIINPSSGPINENWATEVAFPNLNFSQLKGLVSEPRSTNLHIIERRGSIQRVDASNPNTNTQTEVLDIASRIEQGDNGGLRSVVFHPDYNLPGSPNRNHIYAFYSTTAEFAHGFTSNGGDFFYRVSRFTRNEATGTFPSSSELILIQQHSRDEGQHFGGSLGFDQDGFLLIAWGDMEFSNSRVGVDFYQDVQRVDRIFQGAVLRIDVDSQGGSISQPPTRTLQGSTGPNAVAGTSQSCLPDHNYFHVDNFSGRNYMIPSDNYFLLNPPAAGSASFSNTPTHGPALDEHQALGTRNPWRMAVDPVDGDVALFVVGSNSGNGSDFETVDLLSPGANWEWPYLEGSQSQTSETGRSRPPSQYAPIALGTETAPLAYWGKNFGRVASGGLFYRGSQWASIDQQLIFADQNSGRIWALDYKSAGAPATDFSETDGVSVPSNYSVRLLLNSSVGVRQMTAGPTGEEIYMVDGNNVFRLFNAAEPNPEPPALLSQTGVFTNLATMTPREGLIPFEPSSELWSDRAAKLRWIAVPNTDGIDGEYDLASEKITYSEEGEWAYPIGTVLVKHFALPTDLRNPEDPASLVPLETRFSVRGANGTYFFFTYRWRADGSDADLISDAESGPFDIINLDGSPGTQVWEYPSRAQCFECHQSNAGSVLGIKARQLNHLFTYPSTGLTANQLTTFAGLDLFDEGPNIETLDTLLTSANIDDSSESLELRVRSYLDSNCSFCHRPGSEAGRASFDVLLNTPLSLTGIINGETEAGNLGVADAHIITPRSPEQSVLYLRDSSLDPNFRMPPVGRTLNDPDYLPILKAWIGTLGLSEFIAWAQERGIESGLTGDDDEDGFANVFEFVFRQGDANVDLSTLPEIVVTGDNSPSIAIPVSGDALTDGFSVLVEGSDNLVDWFPLGDPQSRLEVASDTSAPGTDGTLEVQVSDDPTVPENYFIRYGVVTP